MLSKHWDLESPALQRQAPESSYSRLSFHLNTGQPRFLGWDRKERDGEQGLRGRCQVHTQLQVPAADSLEEKGDAAFRTGDRATEGPLRQVNRLCRSLRSGGCP